MPEWIDNLKVGDDVICGDYIQKVTAINKLHIACSGRKFRKSDGSYATNDYWSQIPSIKPVTKEAIEILEKKAARKSAITKLKQLETYKASIEAILKIIEIIEEDNIKCQNG